MKEWLLAMQVRDIISLVAWVGAVIGVIIEFNSKIPFHPLSSAVRWMGGILNRETFQKLDELSILVAKAQEEAEGLRKDMEERFNRYDEAGAYKKAADMRNEIINFAENLRMGREYSTKQFEYILGRLSDYYTHCETHHIKNHYIDEEHAYIRAKLQEHMKGNHI